MTETKIKKEWNLKHCDYQKSEKLNTGAINNIF